MHKDNTIQLSTYVRPCVSCDCRLFTYLQKNENECQPTPFPDCSPTDDGRGNKMRQVRLALPCLLLNCSDLIAEPAFTAVLQAVRERDRHAGHEARAEDGGTPLVVVVDGAALLDARNAPQVDAHAVE